VRSGRLKRSVDAAGDDDEDDDVVSLDALLSPPPERDADETPPDLDKPTPGGITMVTAMNKCNESLSRSLIYEKCLEVVDMTDLLNSCVSDAMVGLHTSY